jgi:hypothetical protein
VSARCVCPTFGIRVSCSLGSSIVKCTILDETTYVDASNGADNTVRCFQNVDSDLSVQNCALLPCVRDYTSHCVSPCTSKPETSSRMSGESRESLNLS